MEFTFDFSCCLGYPRGTTTASSRVSISTISGQYGIYEAHRKHKFVDILDDPSSADLSAYVDFPAIRHYAEEISEDMSVYSPITQLNPLADCRD
ncbi:S-adenosyl-L-methionine-dependent methyltransferase MidA [Artemisia annua]|uniref:type II protein arginine methyltransferase n=1 Tax=Artemisia annua TaxID=35608 RepID=A0A2U1NVI7_ARTAN|nr:S-adenosyl-L-methionine-dependent methyltransferase MidA [Artemisia annua]